MSTGELLALDLDLIDEAKSYGHTLLQPPWSPTSPRSPRDELETILPTLIPMLLALPRRLDRIADAVERNEISIGVHLFPDERDRRFATQLTAQLTATIAGASTGLIGALLILAANPRITTETGQLLQGLGIGCVVVAALVLLRALTIALRHLRDDRT